MTGPTVDGRNPPAVVVAVVWKGGEFVIDEDSDRCFRQLLTVVCDVVRTRCRPGNGFATRDGNFEHVNERGPGE